MKARVQWLGVQSGTAESDRQRWRVDEADVFGGTGCVRTRNDIERRQQQDGSTDQHLLSQHCTQLPEIGHGKFEGPHPTRLRRGLTDLMNNRIGLALADSVQCYSRINFTLPAISLLQVSNSLEVRAAEPKMAWKSVKSPKCYLSAFGT